MKINDLEQQQLDELTLNPFQLGRQMKNAWQNFRDEKKLAKSMDATQKSYLANFSNFISKNKLNKSKITGNELKFWLTSPQSKFGMGMEVPQLAQIIKNEPALARYFTSVTPWSSSQVKDFFHTLAHAAFRPVEDQAATFNVNRFLELLKKAELPESRWTIGEALTPEENKELMALHAELQQWKDAGLITDPQDKKALDDALALADKSPVFKPAGQTGTAAQQSQGPASSASTGPVLQPDQFIRSYEAMSAQEKAELRKQMDIIDDRSRMGLGTESKKNTEKPL